MTEATESILLDGAQSTNGHPTAQLKSLPLDSLQDHPDNPRLTLRDEVVKGIKSQLEQTGEFPTEHALLVRPIESGYQIIQGHHRKEAARSAGLTDVPCWVKDLSDEDAYMQLVLGNNQGELSPLEIGLHALHAVDESKGGRGIKGGYAEYAGQLGRTKQYISQLVAAAEVLDHVKPSTQVDTLSNKSKHLAAIHQAPQEVWPILVEQLLSQGWSVKDTEYWVDKVKDFEIPEKWEGIFLPYPQVIERFLATKEFSASTVQKLVKAAERIEEIIASYDHAIDTTQRQEEFHRWLSEADWDVRELSRYQRELLAELEREESQVKERWLHGDWRDALDALDDGQVAVLLTDPPYGIGFRSDYKLDRREERRHEHLEGDHSTEELRQMLEAFVPKLADHAHVLVFAHWRNEPDVREALAEAGLTLRGSLVWVKNNTGMGDPNTTFAPKHERILHAVKGSPMLYERVADVLEADRVKSDRHPTEKPVSLLSSLIEATSAEGEWVADPFGGVASTLVAAQSVDREFWGCELDETYHRAGMERLEHG